MKRIGGILVILTLCLTLVTAPVTACADIPPEDCCTVMMRMLTRAAYFDCAFTESQYMQLGTLIIIGEICVASEEDKYTLKSVYLDRKAEDYNKKRLLIIDTVVNDTSTVEVYGKSFPEWRIEALNKVVDKLDKTGKCVQDGITYTETENGLLIMK